MIVRTEEKMTNPHISTAITIDFVTRTNSVVLHHLISDSTAVAIALADLT
jgi:hypothetical protein